VSLRLGQNSVMPDRLETWDLWYPGPGATGLPFARARINANDGQERVLVHAAPQKLQVSVRDEAGNVVARGDKLERHQPGPMSFLVRRGASITLEDGWPTSRDIGRVVILPGGEAGILKTWWNADDRKEWRWQVEFYNQHRS
jgi:hypothetical protein